jgi:hypothetical protein
MQLIQFRRLLFRAWVYFRLGYSTYLVLPLGVVSTLSVIYYLLIKNVPALQSIFPSFRNFSVISLISGSLASILFGYTHYKKSAAYRAEIDIGIESNPYYFKAVAGKERDVNYPTNIFILDTLARVCESLGINDPQIRAEHERLRDLNLRLMKGESVRNVS